MSDEIKKGDRLMILSMDGEPQYSGLEGTVIFVDDAAQIHGDWGGCAILPDCDKYIRETADTPTTRNDFTESILGWLAGHKDAFEDVARYLGIYHQDLDFETFEAWYQSLPESLNLNN